MKKRSDIMVDVITPPRVQECIAHNHCWVVVVHLVCARPVQQIIHHQPLKHSVFAGSVVAACTTQRGSRRARRRRRMVDR